MKWNGIKREQYEAVRRIVNWEANPPKGGMFHVAAFSENALHVTDVWASEEEFNTFVQNRLMPGVMEAGITSQPEVQLLPVHALFTPAFQPAETVV
jgi:hypothetical protein